jgi:hypothetical protein
MFEKLERSRFVPVILLVGLVIIAVFAWQFWESTYGVVVLAPLVLVGLHYNKRLSKPLSIAFAALLIVICSIYALQFVQTMKTNVETPSEWDFIGFWLHGSTAAQGQNFYDPQFAQQLSQDMTLSSPFRTEIVDVGFWYPPPSIFLFLPLGWFDLQTALIFWYVMQSVILGLTIVLLWKWLLREQGWIGLLGVTSLVFMMRPTLLTLQFAQTNYLLLLTLVLFLVDKDKPRSGVWLALSILVKPFMGALVLYLVIRRRWRALATTIVSLAVASAITILVFGTDTFFSYFQGSSIQQLPDWIYTEPTNQSLLAAILRVTQYDFGSQSPVMNPVYLGLAALMVATTGWLIYSLDERYHVLAASLVVVAAIILYPPSQVFYAILLIVPMLQLWTYRSELGVSLAVVTGILTLLYFFMAFQRGTTTLAANLLMWFVLVGVGWKLTRKPAVMETQRIEPMSAEASS